jgi:carbon storage regulator
MLVLSRKAGEVLCLADGLIKITIVRISDNRVKLAIEAPSDISITRPDAQKEYLCPPQR